MGAIELLVLAPEAALGTGHTLEAAKKVPFLPQPGLRPSMDQ